MRWDSTKPARRDSIGDIAKRMRSDQSELDGFLQSVFYWGDSTASAGYPRTSLTTAAMVTGSVYYLPSSEISYTNRGTAELMLDSDTRRLRVLSGLSSDDSVNIGSAQMMTSYLTLGGVSNNGPMVKNDAKIVIESGLAYCPDSSLSTKVTFAAAYSSPPNAMLTSGTTDPSRTTSSMRYNVGVEHVETSYVSLVAHFDDQSIATINDIIWFWRSVGTQGVV